LRRVLRAPLTCTGLIVTVVFLVLAVIGPWITPYDPSAVSDATLAAPSASALAGHDAERAGHLLGRCCSAPARPCWSASGPPSWQWCCPYWSA